VGGASLEPAIAERFDASPKMDSGVPISPVSRCSKQYMADRILKLITKSNLAGCNTGKSAGFAPLRMSWGEELH
jgi:hypothetical protein